MAEQLVGAAVKIQLADSAIIGEEGKKKVPIVQVATFAAAAAAVITYILAMFWERSSVVYTAGGFSFVVSATDEMVPLFALSTVGGLQLVPAQIGSIMALSGAIYLVFQ